VARDIAEPKAGDAVVRLLGSGVCGTDIEIAEGRIPVAAGRVLGHEGAGLVEEADANRSGLEAGMPVVVDPTISCSRCDLCLEGLPNLCRNGGLLGRELDGVFADRVVVPERNCYGLPDSIRLADAPALQVLATVVHAQEKVSVVPGRVAAVVGLGFTGQLHAQLLAHRGARVLGVTRSTAKRDLAAELACEWTAAPDAAPAAAAAAGLVDLAVECTGTLDGLRQAIALVRPGGTILAYGILTAREGAVPFYDLYYKELNVVNARSLHPRDMPIAIGLVANGAVRLDRLISDRLPLDQVAEAIERSAHGALKVLMEHG
jgi:threonine dehydrogenase-like Zn-dependent dehydrogenase